MSVSHKIFAHIGVSQGFNFDPLPKFPVCQRRPFVQGPPLTLEGDIGCGGLSCQEPPSQRLTTENQLVTQPLQNWLQSNEKDISKDT